MSCITPYRPENFFKCATLCPTLPKRSRAVLSAIKWWGCHTLCPDVMSQSFLSRSWPQIRCSLQFLSFLLQRNHSPPPPPPPWSISHPPHTIAEFENSAILRYLLASRSILDANTSLPSITQESCSRCHPSPRQSVSRKHTFSTSSAAAALNKCRPNAMIRRDCSSNMTLLRTYHIQIMRTP